jgi:peptidoglycan hydrolase-like protein with peptidoglycan-binding domain
MTRRHCVGVTRAAAASITVCLALLCLPTLSIAAAPSDSRSEAADRASALLARGAGYGQPQGEPRVRGLQRSLRAAGHRPGPVDGLYGPLTEAAVERLQRDSGLSVDGIVGPQTHRVLNAEAPPLAPGAGYGQPGGSPQVREVQRRLRTLGQRPGPVDGRYGPRTQAAIERFQRASGQPASGELSPATATALALSDRSDQPTHRASDGRGGNEPSQRAERPASRVPASGADDPSGRADGSRPAGGSDQSRTPTPTAADTRSDGTDEADSTASVLLVGLVVALAAIGGLLAGWLLGTRRRPKASGVAGGPVKPAPVPNGGRKAAKPTAESTMPSSPGPGAQRNRSAALGYASVLEAEAHDGHELRDQVAAIDTACSQRGLVLHEVISDLGEVTGTGPQRPGLEYALQRLAAGEASCLVVAELGRLGPSTPEVGHTVAWLRRREARLVAVHDGIDTGATSGGEAASNLVSLRAVDEQQAFSARTGPPDPVPERPNETANGGGLPARYDVPALRERIRAMCVSGMTLQGIANQLNAENVPTPRGGTVWRPSGVQAAAGYRHPDREAPATGNGQGQDVSSSSDGMRGMFRRSSGRGEGAPR